MGLHPWSLLGSNAGALKAEVAVEEKDLGVRYHGLLFKLWL